ncbi:phosphoesterase family-domain-containing protein [Halteromyces radiatus]|uniref:phosphoesterase family-domain-containing protein n=1 Tax=Halteromyces radiatus TaxID=101107 RepID=UPI0022201A4A|nr:phosphoesterase family-domain-containing protein [Halteromyces radiatus]KAI8100189.1 phosphoesterase family-domain-containing protein [Halteromyces radiatus]
MVINMMKLISITTACLLALASVNATGSNDTSRSQLPGLEKIKHVVYFMQENRSFDTYFGTMSGVRGFADPHVGIQKNGLNLFYQPDSHSTDVKNGTKYLLPYNLKGNRAGCTVGGSNGWTANHNAINGGTNDNWPDGNAPESMGYLQRSQIPYQFALAEAFTICDNYHQSVIASTNPNRVHWMSGTVKGPPLNYVLEGNVEIIPLGWETYPEALTKAGVEWQVYQDQDNFDDNPLAWFGYWRNLKDGPEKQKGLGFLGLQTFYDQAKNGTLPPFSIIVGPTELSEHPNNTPAAGAWLQEQVVNAVMHGKNWANTALFINYDESGGFFDHVQPELAPKDKYVWDYLNFKMSPLGLGPRVPMVIVSPYTRGGHVFSDVSDHSSTLMFMEEWVGKFNNGSYAAPAVNIDSWYRNVTSNLVGAFDFAKPDFSIPTLPTNPKPAVDSNGKWDPTEMCEKLSDPKTTPPYGNQVYPTVEAGSKKLRGANPIGRKLAFVQTNGKALQVAGSGQKLVPRRLQKRDVKKGAIVVDPSGHFKAVPGGNGQQYKLQSIQHPNQCVNVVGTEVQLNECKETLWELDYHNVDAHHHLKHVDSGHYLSLGQGKINLVQNHHDAHFDVYSITT